jgi:hypothetical protein
MEHVYSAMPPVLRPYAGQIMDADSHEYAPANRWVELFGTYIEQFGMPEIYCYASDYPHPEGGRNPMGDIAGKVERFGPEVMRKVFVENGSWPLPD